MGMRHFLLGLKFLPLSPSFMLSVPSLVAALLRRISRDPMLQY
jgi:hypothetical protein